MAVGSSGGTHCEYVDEEARLGHQCLGLFSILLCRISGFTFVDIYIKIGFY